MIKVKDTLMPKSKKVKNLVSPRTVISESSHGMAVSLQMRSSRREDFTSMSPTSAKKSSPRLIIKSPNLFMKKKTRKRKTEVDMSKMNCVEIYRPVPMIDI